MSSGNTFRCFFGQHATAKDATAMQKHFQWCSVYVPELMGWTLACQAQYRAVATGDVPASMAFRLLGFSFNEFQGAELGMIEGSEKRVAFVDVPGAHPLWPATQVAEQRLQRIAYLDCDWYQALQALASYEQALFQLNWYREQHILASLCDLNGAVSNERILVRLGLCHHPIGHMAAQRGLAVERAFQQLQIPLTPDGLSHICLQVGRSIPPVVLARHILQRLLVRFWPPANTHADMTELMKTFHSLIGLFSEADVAQLWHRIRADEAGAQQAVIDAVRDSGFVAKTSV